MAKKTRTQLSADASNVNILDNTSQQVTPAKVRTQYTDERDSVINYADDFTGSVGDLLTIGIDGESITWIPVSDVQTPPGGSTGDLQINAGGGNFGATTDIVITSGNVSIPNGDLSVDGNLSLESPLPILSLKDSDTINSAGRIDFKDGTNTVKAHIGYNATDGFDFTTTSSFTFDGGDATFSGNVTVLNALTVDGPNAIQAIFDGTGLASNAGIRILTDNNKKGFLQFGDTDDVNIGVINYDHANNDMEFITSNGERMSISNTAFTVTPNATFSGDVTVSSTLPKVIIKDSDATTTSQARLEFNDSSDNRIGYLGYTAEDNLLLSNEYATGRVDILTNATTALQIDGNQNATFSGNVEVYNTGGTSVLTINSDANANARIFFDDAGTTIWNIGLNDADNAFNVFNTVSSSNAFKINSDNSSQFFGDLTVNGELDLNGSFIDLGNGLTNGRSALLSSTAQSAIYLTNINTGSAPFDQKGSVIIQPRSDAVGRSVAIATGSGGSEAVAMLIDDSQNATFSGDLALSAYGGGSKTGTATYGLGVDGSGNVVETSPSVTQTSGTFTPIVADAVSGGNTASGTFTGRYIQIGNMITVTFSLVNINTSGMTSTNDIYIQNLPSSSDLGTYYGNIFFRGGVIFSGENAWCRVGNSDNLSFGGSPSYFMTVGDLTSGSADISGTITYITN